MYFKLVFSCIPNLKFSNEFNAVPSAVIQSYIAYVRVQISAASAEVVWLKHDNESTVLDKYLEELLGYLVTCLLQYCSSTLLSFACCVFPGSQTRRVQALVLLICQYWVVAQWQETATGTQICQIQIPVAPRELLLLVTNLLGLHDPNGCLQNLAGTCSGRPLSLKCWATSSRNRTETTRRQGELLGLPPAWSQHQAFPWHLSLHQ